MKKNSWEISTRAFAETANSRLSRHLPLPSLRSRTGFTLIVVDELTFLFVKSPWKTSPQLRNANVRAPTVSLYIVSCIAWNSLAERERSVDRADDFCERCTVKFDTVNLDISKSRSRARYRVSGTNIVSHWGARVVLNLGLPWREARNGAERIENISRFCNIIARTPQYFSLSKYIYVYTYFNSFII